MITYIGYRYYLIHSHSWYYVDRVHTYCQGGGGHLLSHPQERHQAGMPTHIVFDTITYIRYIYYRIHRYSHYYVNRVHTYCQGGPPSLARPQEGHQAGRLIQTEIVIITLYRI